MLTALEGSIGYSIGGARVEVEVGYERFVIKGGDDAAFLLGRELALDTARGQLLSSALGRMSMGDVRRLKKEVVGSIGRGTASPVRAMFSREISDGDTLLAGEMVGVDEGLVIQELSRPEELEKLQHELAKQVSKLAELGELKWLEELETLETEELQKVVGRLKQKTTKAKEKVRELKEKIKEEEEQKWLEKLEQLKPEEIEKLQGSEEIEKLRALVKEGLGDLERLEELKKFKEVETAKEKLKALAGRGEDANEIKKEIENLEEKELQKRLVEVVKTLEAEKEVKLEARELVKDLKDKLEELAAIRELKALRLEERLRELAKVKALAEKLQGLDVQEGLQLIGKIKAELGEQLDLLEKIKREEFKELVQQRAQAIRKENSTQAVGKLVTAAEGAEEIRVLRKLGQLDELIPEERLRELSKVKETLKQLKEVLEEKKLKLVQEKLKQEKDLAGLAKQGMTLLGFVLSPLEKAMTGTEVLGRALKDKEVVKLERQIDRIKALEELTEIAEKRGVATVMRAALTSAMEITKNRGWTDYLNSLDVSERANAARELIAAEKIRKWARDINNLDADE
ncbi:P44/Msp2 family outer membrane protein, partial [Anaplasma marginale]|uniref:P44/Msp2 family outer membrane protein n=1 Tax=Anaplasma marginale TaxID=770 RepID=UPI0023EF1BE4